jgi:hypothetical protein
MRTAQPRASDIVLDAYSVLNHFLQKFIEGVRDFFS